MCHIPAKSWLEYIGTWMDDFLVLVKTDNTAYPALSTDVAKSSKTELYFNKSFERKLNCSSMVITSSAKYDVEIAKRKSKLHGW